jgi:hypothetical protein
MLRYILSVLDHAQYTGKYPVSRSLQNAGSANPGLFSLIIGICAWNMSFNGFEENLR